MTSVAVRSTRLAARGAAAIALLVLTASPVAAFGAESKTAREPAPSGGIGLRLVDIPVATRTDPRALRYIVDHLVPGTVIHRRVEVSNSTAAPLHFVAYAGAATITRGSFLGSAGRTPNDLSTWTSVSPDESEAPAGGVVSATVTIAVPRDAAPGEQYGVVWVETRAAPRGGVGITQVSRVGIRLYVAVGPGGPPAANFNIESLTAQRSPGGLPVILATVHNTGGRALDMSGNLRLDNGPGQLSAGPFPVVLGVTLAIDDREPVTIALNKQLPAGPWNARITLRSGLIERTAHATITFPRTGTSGAVGARSVRHAYPVVGVLALVVTTLSVVGLLIRLTTSRRRRIGASGLRGSVEGARQSAEPLRSSPTP